MVLGDIIRICDEEVCPTDRVVLAGAVGDRYYPVGFCSYRGNYSHLCLIPQDAGEAVPHPKVLRSAAELRQAALDAVGTEFEGWKGGDFLMGMDTPVWVAQEGDCGPALVSWIYDGGELVLVTADISEYLW